MDAVDHAMDRRRRGYAMVGMTLAIMAGAAHAIAMNNAPVVPMPEPEPPAPPPVSADTRARDRAVKRLAQLLSAQQRKVWRRSNRDLGVLFGFFTDEALEQHGIDPAVRP